MITTYFVDADNGSDLQSVGSIDQPFATIGRAVIFAQPGDTVAIREGVYREQVHLIRSGDEGSPITFEAYNGENVLVTTTERLTGWTQHSGNIYKTTFDSSVRGRNTMTLFADGELMVEAHWSDQGAKVNTLDKNNFSTMNSDSPGTITDTALIGLPNDYWTGAFVWSQTANFAMETRRITDFNGATGTLTLSSPFFYDPYPNSKYLIYDHLYALDAPGEWYFDEAANTLYFWAPGGGDPDSYQIEAKIRNDAFNLNGHDYIHIKGIDFRGGDLEMAGSDHVLLQGAHIVAPDRGFGPEGGGGAQSLLLNGSDNIIRDNEVEYVWGTFAHLIGDRNEIVNNYFHDLGYNNSNDAVAYLDVASETSLISHNTIAAIGRAAIGGAGVRSVIQYNDISQTGRMSDDGGAIYFANTSLGNSVIHHNMIHDISNFLGFGIYFDSNVTDVAVHHNIAYDTPLYGGIVNIPNSYVLWFNNTHYNAGTVHAYHPPGSVVTSTGSKFFNNIFSSLQPDLTSGASPAEASHNFVTSGASNFVNAAAGDFRLVAGSGAVNAGREIDGITDGFTGPAPDAGALELDQPMWEYGHNFTTLPNPVYQWQPIPYTNRVTNPSFEDSLSGWTSAAGSPAPYRGNAWNYQADGLATFGSYALELAPGERIEQTIDGLVPNTTYEITAQARLVKDLQLESHNGSSGSFTTGVHRDETYLGGVNTGEWVRFNGVDFGSGSPLYNRIEIGTTQNSSLSVQLRLDSPTGQLIGTLNVPSQGEPWFMTRANIAAVTGTHDLYVVFQGNGGSNGKFDRLRLLDTNVAERVTLGVADYDGPGSETSTDIGGAYWSSAPESLTFTTGPNATSATIFIAKEEGQFNGYVDFVTFTGDAFQPPEANVLELFVDPVSGRTVLRNNTENPLSFDAYTIFDPAGALQPHDWFSLEDQGYDNQIWFEAAPTATRLSELTDDSVTRLEPGQAIYLGAVVDPALAGALTFDYFLSSGGTLTRGVVHLEDPELPALPGDYNGDLVVDAADYAMWRDRLGAVVASFDQADGNGNGIVDEADYRLWVKHFGETAPPAALSDAGGFVDDGSASSLLATATEEMSFAALVDVSFVKQAPAVWRKTTSPQPPVNVSLESIDAVFADVPDNRATSGLSLPGSWAWERSDRDAAQTSRHVEPLGVEATWDWWNGLKSGFQSSNAQ